MSESAPERLPDQANEAEWRRLFETWDPRIRSYLARLLPDSRDSEEITLETFALAWRTHDRFRGGKVSTWLFGLATNLARNRRRGWLRRIARLAGPVESMPEVGFDDNAHSDDLARMVREAVQSLSEELRAPLVLTAFEGLSQKETAKVLGCTVKTVEHRVAAARELLRSKLKCAA